MICLKSWISQFVHVNDGKVTYQIISLISLVIDILVYYIMKNKIWYLINQLTPSRGWPREWKKNKISSRGLDSSLEFIIITFYFVILNAWTLNREILLLFYSHLFQSAQDNFAFPTIDDLDELKC